MEFSNNDGSIEHTSYAPGYIIRLISPTQQVVSEVDASESNQDISDDENSLENSIIIEDIPYQGDTSNNSDVEELQSLLISWKQEHLLDCFMGEKVFVNVLQVIKRHHIEKLLKKFDMGTQILFEHNLEQWRQLKGIPLENKALITNRFEQSPNIESASTSDSDRASPGSSLRYSPYSLDSSSDPGSKIVLSKILNESPKASMLSEYFKKFSKFEDEQRNALIGIIARYFEDNRVPMTMKTSYRLEQEIIETFPTEKLEYYRTSKRGKLYNKWRNSNISFKHAVSDYLSPKPQILKENKEPRTKLQFVPEEDAEATIRSLKFDNLSAEEFDHCWKACSKYRLIEIDKLDSTSAILEKWPFYKQPSGFRLIDMDFITKYENGDGFLKTWEEEVPKIISFLTNGNVKDKSIKLLLERLKNENIDENGRNAALLWALHGYFVPTNKVVKKDMTGRNQTTKFTIRDSQQSFLYLGKSVQEVEEWIEFLSKKKTAIQPFVFAIGEDITKIEEIYTYFDEIKYKFFNILRAVDICLKIIYLFNLNFPTESVMFWSFIETHFYKFDTGKSFPKTHILCEYLKKFQ